MRWTEAPHGAIANGNHMGGARSTPPLSELGGEILMAIFLLIVFIILVVVVMFGCVATVKAERYMNELRQRIQKQPTIPDQEFCALIPEVHPDVCLTVRRIVSETTGWDQDEIHPDTKLIEFDLW